ncbi:MAG: hypothetical protein FJZ56_00145 [Chlamydiae bacterium]|nr:hypothetical protein [Chlamydiota bacterium]
MTNPTSGVYRPPHYYRESEEETKTPSVEPRRSQSHFGFLDESRSKTDSFSSSFKKSGGFDVHEIQEKPRNYARKSSFQQFTTPQEELDKMNDWRNPSVIKKQTSISSLETTKLKAGSSKKNAFSNFLKNQRDGASVNEIDCWRKSEKVEEKWSVDGEISQSALNKFIEDSISENELRDLWSRRKDEFKFKDALNALHKISRLIKKEEEEEVVSPLAHEIAQKALELMVDRSTANVVNLLWVSVSLGLRTAEFFRAYEEKALDYINDFSVQNFSVMIWAYGISAIMPPDRIVERMQLKALEAMDEFEPLDLINFSWAIASLNLPAREGLFDSIRERAKVLLPNIDKRGLANLAWSFAIKSPQDAEFFAMVKSQIQDHCVTDYNDRQLMQLRYVHLHVQPHSLIPNHWRLPRMQEVHRFSNFQKEVTAKFKSLGIEFSEEYYESAFHHNIDIALVRQRIAIEVDGPNHYALETREPLGATVLRNNLLRKSGWKVVLIPFWEWNRLNNQREKTAYIQRKLKDHVEIKGFKR